MALYNIPPLPKDIHPFYSIWRKGSGEYYLCTNDTIGEFVKYAGNYYLSNVTQVYQLKDEWVKIPNNSPNWESEHEYPPYIHYHFLGNSSICICEFSNYDIYREGGENLYVKKSPNATEIKIAGGNNITLKKGMVWDLSEAVQIEPKEAFQCATFESNNKSVCTVDEKGHLVAVGEGDCIITITSE